ncbi:MAG: toll/interleukin-1 receptor domain-containing protein [Acidobacteria bacterium]|nr:toll/interleukin-1 receptor domain-containing protein [Acidobacteriota bacterium]
MKEKDKTSPKIFLSYAAQDVEFVHELRWALAAAPDLQIFSTDKLSAGEDWVSRLKSELSSSDIFIMILTPNSVESPWVLQELGAAWGLKKSIFIVYTDVRLVSRLPVSLNQEQLVDIKNIQNLEFFTTILTAA